MEKEKIKIGMNNREISKDIIKLFEVPSEARELLVKSVDELKNETFVTHSYYNGGGELVNYGLNTFVKDIYSVNSHVIFSDRFGNYSNISDKQVAEIIDSSSICVSAEGVILFYKEDYIYATLNCKSGCIINTETLIGRMPGTTMHYIAKIFVYNGLTYVKTIFKGVTTDNVSYYALDFSFKLYEAYGTQIDVKTTKLSEKYAYDLEDSILKRDDLDIPIINMQKNDNILSISNTSKKLSTEEFIEQFDTYNFCKSNEVITPKEEVTIKHITYNGDMGINNCINSFVKEIYFTQISISKKGSIFKKYKREYFKNSIVVCDRFGNRIIQDYKQEETLSFIKNSKLYISLEGVIISLDIGCYDYYKSYFLISLDGIVWKRYDIDEVFDIHEQNLSVEITKKYSGECISIYSFKDYKKQLICEYMINFTFNFWDLYSSPVEAHFTLVE